MDKLKETMEYKSKSIIENLEGSITRELKAKLGSIKITDRKTGKELNCKSHEDYGSFWEYDLPPLDSKTDEQLKLVIGECWEDGFVLDLHKVEEGGIVDYACYRRIIQIEGRNQFNNSSIGLTELQEFFNQVVEELSQWPHIRIETREE